MHDRVVINSENLKPRMGTVKIDVLKSPQANSTNQIDLENRFRENSSRAKSFLIVYSNILWRFFVSFPDKKSGGVTVDPHLGLKITYRERCWALSSELEALKLESPACKVIPGSALQESGRIFEYLQNWRFGRTYHRPTCLGQNWGELAFRSVGIFRDFWSMLDTLIIGT